MMWVLYRGGGGDRVSFGELLAGRCGLGDTVGILKKSWERPFREVKHRPLCLWKQEEEGWLQRRQRLPRGLWGADGRSSVGSGSRGHGGLSPCRLPADNWKLGFELQDEIMVNDAKFWDRLH